MKTRSPTKEEIIWLNKVGEFGCIVCHLYEQSSNVPCSPHHIDGRVKNGAHFKTIGLCWEHHQSNDSNQKYESVHGNKSRFEKRYGKESQLLNKLKERIL